jgi:hypothetical protein
MDEQVLLVLLPEVLRPDRVRHHAVGPHLLKVRRKGAALEAPGTGGALEVS